MISAGAVAVTMTGLASPVDGEPDSEQLHELQDFLAAE